MIWSWIISKTLPSPMAIAEMVLLVILMIFGFNGWNYIIHDPSVRQQALNGYVAEVELQAQKAKFEELQRQKDAADAANSDLSKQLDLAQKQSDQADKKIGQEIANHEAKSNNHKCSLTSSDIGWLQQ